MTRVAHCIDNGLVEGFWGIIKYEMYQMYDIKDDLLLGLPLKITYDATQLNDYKVVKLLIKYL